MVFGNQKGSSFERETAKDLSLWLSDGKDQKQLVRSISSGGAKRLQSDTEEAHAHVGDIAANGPLGRLFRSVFAVECKHYAKIDFWLEFTSRNNSSFIKEWWFKARAEAQAHGLCPLFIIRENGKPKLLGYPMGVFNADLLFPQAPAMTLHHLALTLVPFKAFLENRPEVYYDSVKKYTAGDNHLRLSQPD